MNIHESLPRTPEGTAEGSSGVQYGDYCRKCGQCCIANGLIPPFVSDDVESLPEWLRVLVIRLRAHFVQDAHDYPCIFLTDDRRCAIHDACKPPVCAAFTCHAETNQQED